MQLNLAASITNSTVLLSLFIDYHFVVIAVVVFAVLFFAVLFFSLLRCLLIYYICGVVFHVC